VPSFAAFHCEGHGSPGRDRVDPEFVAEPGCRQDRVGVIDTAKGAQGEKALVFEARRSAGVPGVAVFAADGAVGTGGSFVFRGSFGMERFERVRAFELAVLEIPGGENREPVERGQVRHSSEFAVARGGFSLRAPGKFAGPGRHPVRLGDGGCNLASDGDGLQALGSHYRSESSAPGVPPSVRDGRQAHEMFSRDTDSGHFPVGPKPLLRLGGRPTPEARGA
jgi:hypothetical protein